MQKTCDYSVVIPVYNSVSSLHQLSSRIDKVFRDEIRATYEIIFVDDGSPNPESWNTLKHLSDSHPNIKSIRLTMNFGQIAALVCGICQARGHHIITMDDDLQHCPEDIPKLIAHEEHDIVSAGFGRLRHGLLRRLTHLAKGWMDQMLMGKPRGIQMSSFILMNRQIAEGIRSLANPYPLLSYLLFSQTQDVVNVTVTHRRRSEGKSGYSHRKRFHLFTNLIINHSPLLLSTVGLLGVITIFLAFTGVIFVLIRQWFWGIRMTGTSLMFLALFLISGILLFSLGVIGKYLFRILQTVVNRPPYRIREIVGGNLENRAES